MYFVLLWLLSYCLLIHCAAVESPSLLSKRARKQNIAVVAGESGRNSQYYCDSSQVAAIDKSISWMNQYAKSAYDFLYEDDSEKTSAFIGWFGVTNMDKATYIRLEVYEPIQALGTRAEWYVSELEDLEETLVIGCGTVRNTDDCRKRDTHLVANKLKNIITVCPSYFQNHGAVASDEAEQQSMLKWKIERTLLPAAGFALLHEVTHITGVVGDFEYWKDDLASTDHAYAPSEAITLPDLRKINNAQNFALFALDIRTNPGFTSKQVDMDSKNPQQYALRWIRAGVSGRLEQP